MSDRNADRLGALLEHIESQNQAVLEVVGDMQQKVALLPVMQQDIAELKQDMKVVKAAVTATTHDLKQHKSLPAHVAHGRA